MILVTGGTGMVGAHVLLECVKKNQQVRATYRREESLGQVQEFFRKVAPQDQHFFDRIKWIKTDLNDLYNLEIAFEGVQYVYHCAAKVSLAQYHEEKLMKVNVEGTANIVNLCLKHQVKKLGYLSSIAALGARKTIPVVNENHAWSSNQNHTAYAHSKYGAELEVWRASQEGLNVVILNPGVILGAHFWNRSSGTIIHRVARGLNYYPVGKTAVVAVEDVVKVLLLLMESSIKNKRFILVAENLKQKSLIDKIAESLNRKKPIIPLTKAILSSLFIFEKTFEIIGLRKGFLSLGIIEALCSNQEYDGTNITHELDFTYSNTKKVISQIAKQY